MAGSASVALPLDDDAPTKRPNFSEDARHTRRLRLPRDLVDTLEKVATKRECSIAEAIEAALQAYDLEYIERERDRLRKESLSAPTKRRRVTGFKKFASSVEVTKAAKRVTRTNGALIRKLAK